MYWVQKQIGADVEGSVVEGALYEGAYEFDNIILQEGADVCGCN